MKSLFVMLLSMSIIASIGCGSCQRGENANYENDTSESSDDSSSGSTYQYRPYVGSDGQTRYGYGPSGGGNFYDTNTGRTSPGVGY